jgi:hypothetical protein
MRISTGLARTLVVVVFLVSAAAGIETAWYRYVELAAEASGAYAVPLAQHHLSPRFFVAYFLVSEGLVAAAFAATGLFIALRGPRTVMALLAASALMLYGVTIPPPMHALIVNAPALPMWLLVERSIGIGLFIVFLYVFPDGRFDSWIVRGLAVAVLAWTFAWPFVPGSNPYHFTHPWPFIAIAALFASAVAVQFYWYYRARGTLERQQTKWIVYAVTASVAGDFITHLPWQIFHLQRGADLVVLLVHQPFFVAFQLAVPIAIGFSVLYFHLWEIDVIVSRTVLYAALTTAAAIVWEAVNLTAGKLIAEAMGPQASAYAGGTATVVTGFFLKPMYEALKRHIDRRLTPQTLDLSDEFPELAPDVRHRITVAHVVDALANHVSPLFDVDGSAVYLARDGMLVRHAVGVRGAGPFEGGASEGGVADILPDDDAMELLRNGKTARSGEEPDAPLFVPLVVPRSRHPDLLGVLVLGRRAEEKGYSQLEISALEELGRKAGMAVYLSEARTAPAVPAPNARRAAHPRGPSKSESIT